MLDCKPLEKLAGECCKKYTVPINRGKSGI
jgi:hypothetical protein